MGDNYYDFLFAILGDKTPRSTFFLIRNGLLERETKTKIAVHSPESISLQLLFMVHMAITLFSVGRNLSFISLWGFTSILAANWYINGSHL